MTDVSEVANKVAETIADGPKTKDTWKHRRRVIYGTLMFSGMCLVYLLIFGKENSALHGNMSTGFFTLITTTLLYYVAGSTYEDTRK